MENRKQEIKILEFRIKYKKFLEDNIKITNKPFYTMGEAIIALDKIRNLLEEYDKFFNISTERFGIIKEKENNE